MPLKSSVTSDFANTTDLANMLYSDVGADSASCVMTKSKKDITSVQAQIVVIDVMQASESEIQPELGFRMRDQPRRRQ